MTDFETEEGHGKKTGAKRHVKYLTKTSCPHLINVLRFNRNPMFPHSHATTRPDKKQIPLLQAQKAPHLCYSFISVKLSKHFGQLWGM
jgi:hypothetical protein